MALNTEWLNLIFNGSNEHFDINSKKCRSFIHNIPFDAFGAKIGQLFIPKLVFKVICEIIKDISTLIVEKETTNFSN